MRPWCQYSQTRIWSVKLNHYFSHWMITWLRLLQVNCSVGLLRRIQKLATSRNQLHFMIVPDISI
uniref:Uncharacterized protein n=1 Tax=Arundo donax TaxID=35708 RepID=A0A0A9AGA7_ARUDO